LYPYRGHVSLSNSSMRIRVHPRWIYNSFSSVMSCINGICLCGLHLVDNWIVCRITVMIGRPDAKDVTKTEHRKFKYIYVYTHTHTVRQTEQPTQMFLVWFISSFMRLGFIFICQAITYGRLDLLTPLVPFPQKYHSFMNSVI
jgi:hypothetical protein